METKISGNWQSILRLAENKKEIFQLFAKEVVQIAIEKLISSTIGSSVLSNQNFAGSTEKHCDWFPVIVSYHRDELIAI